MEASLQEAYNSLLKFDITKHSCSALPQLNLQGLFIVATGFSLSQIQLISLRL